MNSRLAAAHDRFDMLCSNPKVLVVEDSALMNELLRCQLLGHAQVRIVQDPGPAMAAVEADRPDIVLMDIYFDGRNRGAAVGRAIQDLGIPVVYISGIHPEEAAKLGTVPYLQKPVSQMALREAIGL